MRHLVFNLALVPCSLFVFLSAADAHPHKLGKVNHGKSLESYQIELDFSVNYMVPDGSTFNTKLANKNKDNKKVIGKKPIKSKSTQKSKQIKKRQKERKK